MLPGRLVLVFLLVVGALVGCSGGAEERSDEGATGAGRSTSTTAATSSEDAPTTAAQASTVPPASTTTTASVAPAPARPATESCPAVPARVSPREDRPRYTIDLDVRPAENDVVGRTEVRFRPDLAIDHLVFRLWANSPRTFRAGSRIDIHAVRLDGRAVEFDQPDTTTIVVPLASSVAGGSVLSIGVDWRLTLPGPVNDRLSRNGDAIRLGSFHPILPWEPGRGWARQPPTSGFAEASVAPVSDYTLRVRLPEGSGLNVLASGVEVSAGEWRAEAVPDVALSIGRFRAASRAVDVGDGVMVQVIVGVHDPIGEAPDPYVEKVARVLQDFSRRYGTYPWPAYTLAITPDLSGGIEYPMHVMQGPGRIGRTTSHEVGHMWFYGLVVNNQGREPWLDEGLATWVEGRYEGTTSSLMAREIPSGGRGRVGEPMTYWETRPSIYYRSVYVQGAQTLGALGPPDLVDCALRHYVARQAFRIATTADLLAALEVVFPDARATLERYGAKPAA